MVELLSRQDKMCMAHGVENRVPFLDHRVVEFAKGLATDMKVSAPLMRKRGHVTFHTKSLLKNVASEYYGEEFAFRQKSGFAVPMNKWFRLGPAEYFGTGRVASTCPLGSTTSSATT